MCAATGRPDNGRCLTGGRELVASPCSSRDRSGMPDLHHPRMVACTWRSQRSEPGDVVGVDADGATRNRSPNSGRSSQRLTIMSLCDAGDRGAEVAGRA